MMRHTSALTVLLCTTALFPGLAACVGDPLSDLPNATSTADSGSGSGGESSSGSGAGSSGSGAGSSSSGGAAAGGEGGSSAEGGAGGSGASGGQGPGGSGGEGGAPCVPTTCAAEGKDCGTVPNGCGGSLSCGSCTAPQTCGGGGMPNVCGCILTVSSSAPVSAGLGVSMPSSTLEEWTWPDAIDLADSTNTSTNFLTRAWSRLTGSTPTSQTLYASNFGFNLPAGATVLGVEVEIRKRQRDKLLSSWNLYDDTVRLMVNGIATGQNKASSADWPLSWTYASYGGAADTWGSNLGAADVNAASFGVGLRAHWTGTAGNNDAEVDHVRITLTYEHCM